MAAAQRLGHGRVHLIEIRHQFHTRVTHVEATKRGVPNGARLGVSSPFPLPERMTWRHLHTARGVRVPLPEATSEPPNHSKPATVAYALLALPLFDDRAVQNGRFSAQHAVFPHGT